MSKVHFGWKAKERRVLIGLDDEVFQSEPLEPGRGVSGEIGRIVGFLVEAGMITQEAMERQMLAAKEAYEGQGVAWNDTQGAN